MKKRFATTIFCLLLYTPAIAAEQPSLREDMAGLRLFEKEQFDAAATKLHTPYRRGVALYRAGRFAEAEASFAETGDEDFPAQFNRGNSLFQLEDYQGAISAYEQALTITPDDKDAKHNLELAKKMLEQAAAPSQGGSGGKEETPPEQPSTTAQEQDDNGASPNQKGEKPSDYLLQQLNDDPAELAKRSIQKQEAGKDKLPGENQRLPPW